MPLPSDEKVVRLANDLLAQFDAMFGLHPGFRPAHAKGMMLSGTFTPSAESASLTRAPHVARSSTPVTARLSNGTGLPSIPDNIPDANPRGLAIRFHLADHVHTDIVSHSTDGFPTRTGEEFLAFLRAAAAGDPSAFLSAHPAALAFVQTPKPSPESFATEAYFAVTAFRFVNRQGLQQYGRYRIMPGAGVRHLDDAAAKSKSENYLFDELTKRIAQGPVRFNIHVQIAKEGDPVNDATIHWPADRPLVHFGTLDLTAKAPDDEEHRRIIFDPIPRVDGIEASGDPLLELRAAIYLLSGRRRRQAIEAQTPTSHRV
ncbi:MAG: catalase family peroxidase [Bryobacterales bacterium]|nr:catalase family peroxidase [Bryobacterales bacterium]MBV9401251.1 catalase family peroxidase [Bryobacterales bacterium]